MFNPVPKMDLIELAFPDAASETTRERARTLCQALGKTAVEVPDTPGFVVNRLLFPYLFEAVRLMERTGLEPEAIDTCMRLGAGHPLGPLAVLDLVGLDVSAAIGRTIGAEVPERIERLIAEGALGRKAGPRLLRVRRLSSRRGDPRRGRQCLVHIERRLGYCRGDERTLIAPLLQKTLEPGSLP